MKLRRKKRKSLIQRQKRRYQTGPEYMPGLADFFRQHGFLDQNGNPTELGKDVLTKRY